MKKVVQFLLCHVAKGTILTLSSLLSLCMTTGAQTVRYVAAGGSNSGTGTFNNPYNTIPKAISAATTVNGDTIKVAAGNYTGPVTISKQLTIIGTGATSSDVVINGTTYTAAAGNGFAITASNVTIANIKVTNFNVGITNTVAVSNLTLDNLQLVENFGAGFNSTVSLDSLSITNSIISSNGNKAGSSSNSIMKRGIFLQNAPTYAKIKFDNNTVDLNGLVGIDISSVSATTSINGITITNNLVRNNLDAQISTWLGTANPLKKAIVISNNRIVLSDTARYGIEIRNPAGNAKTSGDGSVVISNNTISVVSHTGNSRDMAAITVIRRKEGSALTTINDQPQGVVIFGNTISDFQNPKAGDAYGIVLGGSGHKVYDNIISNTEFSIQLQKGNTNFAANTNSPDVAGQVNTAYFDRDNSKEACVEIGSNTITTSGDPRLTTGSATTTLTLPSKRTENTTIGETFCTIQQAIDFKATVAGNTITANSGIFDEQVIINKGLIIDGIDSSNRIATFSGTPAGVKGIFTITAQNVTIKNFKFIVDLARTHSAIVTSGNASNLLIMGNTILSDNPSGGVLLAYGVRNGININISGTTGATQANPLTNVIIQANTIDARNNKTFRAGVGADQTSGLLVGGDDASNGNKFLASVNHDVLIRNYYGAQTVKNNTLNGGGVEVSISNGNGAVIVSNNTFDGTYSHTIPTAMLRVFTNTFPTRTINFSDNQFINQKWAISFENTRNVILDRNDITAAYDSFRLISVNTKLRQSASPSPLETIDIKLINNNLSATTGVTTGNALEFLNFDQRPANNYVNGNYVIGELGNENSFNANIPTFVMVSNLNGVNTLSQPFLDLYPEYNGVQYGSTTGYWTKDIDARHNRFFVGGTSKLASEFSAEDLTTISGFIFDKNDDKNIGLVNLQTPPEATSVGLGSPVIVNSNGIDKNVFSIVSNPVKNKTVVLQMKNVDRGVYTITLYNNAGQQLTTTTIDHSGGTATQTINLTNARPGVYFVHIAGNNARITKRVVVE